MASHRVEVRLRMAPVTMAVAVLVAVHMAVLAAVVSRSYYWQDDFVHLLQARSTGLTRGYLVQDYHDHLEILTNFVYWLLSRSAGSSFVLPGLLVLVLNLLAAVLLWLLLRELFGPRPQLLVPLAVFCFSPLCLVPDTWLAAGLQLLPLQVSMLATCLCMLRYEQRGGRRWLFASWTANALGLLFWEKAVLVLPFTLAVIVLLAWSGLTWRERRRRLQAHWRAWLGHVVLVAAYLALYLSVVDGSERASAHAAPYLHSATTLVGEVFLPGLLGGPWWVHDAQRTLYPAPGTPLVVLFLALLALLVYASFRVSGRRALAAWVLLAGHLAVAVLLVLWGRGAYLQLVAHDPRYLVDVLPTAAVAIAAAFTPRRGLEPTPGQRRLSRGLSPSVAGAAAVVVAASCLLTTFQLVPVVTHGDARSYVEAVRSNLAMAPSTAIADGSTPPGIVPMAQSQLLAALGIADPFGQPGTRIYSFDGFGALQPAEIPYPTLRRRGPRGRCGWKVHEQPVRLPALPENTSPQAVVRLGYLSGQGGLLHLSVAGSEQTLSVPGGLGEAWFSPHRTGPMHVWLTGEPGGLCLGDVTAGVAWPTS